MRHVPEDELHPYLDQALSRSQCVEIETHLAQCAHCRDRRDMIAALRDRTTALLGQLTPRNLIIPPPFESLAERLSRRPVTPLWQIRLKRASLWAAGVMAAVGTGWAGRSLLDPHAPAPGVVQESAAAPTTPVELGSALPLPPAAEPVAESGPAERTLEVATDARVLPDHQARIGTPRIGSLRMTNAASGFVAAPPTLRLASAVPPLLEGSLDVAPAPREERKLPFGPLWQQVQWEEALEKAGSGLPYIEGLLVVGVLLRQDDSGERPTTVVAQQDPSGEILFSIEGPVEKVNEVLKTQRSPGVHASEMTRTTPDYLTTTGGTVRRTSRVLTVTGRMSVDSLNVLARLATIR